MHLSFAGCCWTKMTCCMNLFVVFTTISYHYYTHKLYKYFIGIFTEERSVTTTNVLDIPYLWRNVCSALLWMSVQRGMGEHTRELTCIAIAPLRIQFYLYMPCSYFISEWRRRNLQLLIDKHACPPTWIDFFLPSTIPFYILLFYWAGKKAPLVSSTASCVLLDSSVPVSWFLHCVELTGLFTSIYYEIDTHAYVYLLLLSLPVCERVGSVASVAFWPLHDIEGIVLQVVSLLLF